MTRAPVLAALCALFVAAFACAAPYIPTNTPEQGRQWAYCDSVVHRVADGGNRITLALFAIDAGSARGQRDSVLLAWRNGGATPKFRRIQGIRLFAEGGCTQQFITLDVFHSDGTSANNKSVFLCEQVLELPMEADSIHLTSVGGSGDLDFCIW